MLSYMPLGTVFANPVTFNRIEFNLEFNIANIAIRI